MKKKTIWLIVNSLIVITLLVTSCTQVVSEEEEVVVEEEEEVYDQLDPQGLLILADKLERGEPYVQRFRHFMTGEILEKRIVGIKDGRILYIEEMPNELKLECRFSLESAKVIAQYYRDCADAGGEPVGKTYVINDKEVENPLQECTDIGECVLINPWEEQQPNETTQVEEPTPTGTQTSVFPDENLAAAVRVALGKGLDEEITVAELGELSKLDVSFQGIADLAGIEYCVNLTELNPEGNQISDISPLAGLTKLTKLELSRNRIADISPLASLASLTTLYLGANQISDISPLASLTNLNGLYLGANQISEISPLAGLTNLTELGLERNQISDISPLAGFTNLTSLRLERNQISDISPLASLANLSYLYLKVNPLSDDAVNVIIPQLEERGVYVSW